MRKNAYLYIFDTMADWEPGYIIAELHSGRYFKKNAVKYTIRTVSLTRDSVTTMGGVKIVPDLTIENVVTHEAGLLLLPGGATWLEDLHAPVFNLVKEFLDHEIIVAAICGATIGLAANGFLNHRSHTSNDLDHLCGTCPSYTGKSFYLPQPVVTDGNLITASGLAPLDFAHAILKQLNVFLPTTLKAWYQLYQTHQIGHYFALMESLSSDA